MLIKRVLILLPVIIFALLLQSFFWVPTYDEQVKGNPLRLEEFITASIGDARILNPILSADSASSTIEDQVFDGLIDRDEDLKFRGRLATGWKIYEEVYFYLNPKVAIKGRKISDPEAVRKLLLAQKGNIKDVEIIPPQKGETEILMPGPDPINLKVRFKAPHRFKVTLKEVDQNFFLKMEKVLGKGYFKTFRPVDHIEMLTAGHEDKLSAIASQVLPATENNPVIIFDLRKGVKFHDGQEFDAGDVKFTYEAIMDPKNLSPRTSDFEPVKYLEVIDRYKVKVVYKRLYFPAFGTWGMGMLPEHLLNSEAMKREAEAKGEDPEKFSMRDSDFNRHPVGTGPFVFRE
ncbi:MAG TPA: peptide ABC transporter substrate-binding protein, partial [Nitrospirae bacterium]|nr:peptide ABC transporter substrate-binding protein [Nitrospirota bacterium]